MHSRVNNLHRTFPEGFWSCTLCIHTHALNYTDHILQHCCSFKFTHTTWCDMAWHWSALHYIALVALHCNDIPNDRRSPTSQGFEVRSFRPCFRLRNGASLASLRSMGWCSHHWWRIWGRVIDHHQSISVPGGLLTPDSCGFNISHHFIITSLVQQELQIEKKDTTPLTRNLSISVICIKKSISNVGSGIQGTLAKAHAELHGWCGEACQVWPLGEDFIQSKWNCYQ